MLNQKHIATLTEQTLSITDLPNGIIGELFNNGPEGGLGLRAHPRPFENMIEQFSTCYSMHTEK